METKARLGLTVGMIAVVLFLGGSLVYTQGRQTPETVTAPAKTGSQWDPVELRWGEDVPEVLVNQCVVLRIRAAAGGYTPWQRGEIVAQRLRTALTAGADLNCIGLGIENGEAVVRAPTGILVTVDRVSAQANQTPTPYLALAWANNIRASIGIEPLGVEEAFQTMSRGRSVTARASWYGSRFHGRLTASGEVFDQNIYTAAHRTLPFGTLVLVTNPITERSVLVRINDRGPFIEGRSIDLSRAAARAIGMEAAGVADVEITVVSP